MSPADDMQKDLFGTVVEGLKTAGYEIHVCEHRSDVSLRLPGSVVMIPAGSFALEWMHSWKGELQYRGRPMPKASEFENPDALADWLIRDR